MRRFCVIATAKFTRNPHTVLSRMASDKERADRIRSLKQDHPELRWRQIADYCGVELRSAQMWQETGGISYENAKALGELMGVDVDWIMRGPRPRLTPTPFSEQGDVTGRLDAIERAIAEAVAERDRHTQEILELLDVQNELLARQSEILARIELATARVDEASKEFARHAAEAGQGLRGEPARPLRAEPKRAPKRNHPAS